MTVDRLTDAEQWEMLIPRMGYFALVRNLRNFDGAQISEATKKFVAEKISDPEEVKKSGLFPYRFLSAWKSVDSVQWAAPLEAALSHSVSNVPELPGRTLVLVDTSGSMQNSVGGDRSQAQRWEVAGLFGGVIAARNSQVDLAIYATGVAPLQAPRSSTSILRFVEQMRGKIGSVGHGTQTWSAIQSEFKDHDRIVVLTDEQSHDSGKRPGDAFLHVINLAGYEASTAPKDPRTFAYGGFQDTMFSLIPLCENGASGKYPWNI